MTFKAKRKFKKFWRIADSLKKEFNLKVKIERANPGKQFDGVCYKDKRKFRIKIDPSLPQRHAIDILIHEVSHILAWNKEKNDHGPKWGIAYSKVYRFFLEEFIEKGKQPK